MRIGNIDAVGQAVFDDSLNTATTPAISFDGDTNTGITRVSDNEMGFATDGVFRFNITTSGAVFTVPLTVPDGTAGAPSLTFTSDPDTGVYNAGANSVGVSAGGTNVATFDSSGITVVSGSNVVLSGNGEVTGLPATPSGPTAAASKAYVDTVGEGLDPKESVRVATTAALPAVTAAGSGVGKTLTAVSDGVVTVDGEDLTVANGFSIGDRVLVKNQASSIDNGIYTITTLSDVAASLVLTRATDQDGTPSSEVSGGNFTFVEEGSTNADTGWVVIGDGELTVDTDSILWSQFTGAGSITAGVGLGQSGSTVFFDADGLSAAGVLPVDELVFHDVSFSNTATDTGSRKVTVSSFATTIGILTNSAGPNPILGSNGVSVADSGTTVDVELEINGLTPATIVGADELVFDDGGTGTNAKTTVTNFLADLDIVNALGGNGFAVQTAADTYTARTITVAGAGDGDGLAITNGDGVATNPAISLDIVGTPLAAEDVAAGDLFILNNDSASANEAFTLAEVAAGVSASLSLAAFTTVAGDSGGPAVADTTSDSLLLSGATNGGITTIASDGPEVVTFSVTPVDLTTGAATLALGDFIIVSDSADTASTVALKYTFTDVVQDLDIPNGITVNGLIVRTAEDAYASRTITASAVASEEGLTVTDGSGASGNPTIGLDINGLTAASADMTATDEFVGFDGTNNVKFTGQEIADGVATIISIDNTNITDADLDTFIEVEASTDQDIIHFSVGGTPTGYGAVADIMLLGANAWTVAMGTANVATTVGAPISLTAGTGNTTGAGGAFNITGGDGGTGTGGDGGAIVITGGSAGAGSDGDGGDIELRPGALDGSGADGVVRVIGPTTGTAGEIRLEDNTGGEYIGLQAAGTISSSFTLTLPDSDATGTQALVSDGAGTLSWSDISAVAFGTIVADSGTSPVADVENDTLTLVGATNGGIATVGDSGTDTVTFAMDIADLTALGATPAVTDLVAISDTSDSGNTKSVTITELAAAVTGTIELDDLSDVDLTAEAAGFALVFDSAAGNWEAKKIQHTEAFASATQWVVTHDLNQQYPVVTVYDSGDEVIIPATITATSTTVTTIDFAVATAGQVTVMAVNVS